MTGPLGPEIDLALAAAPEPARAPLNALWGLDAALGKVLVTGTDVMLSRIKLAWWREALERLDRERAPAEPVLQAVATTILPAGISGAALAEMEPGWSALTESGALEEGHLHDYAARRGGLMFSLSATLLGEDMAGVSQAGEAWALVDLARHSSDEGEIAAALAIARGKTLPGRWPRRLRPIGMLAMLAARDLKRSPAKWEPLGAPPRVARMMRHRLTGW